LTGEALDNTNGFPRQYDHNVGVCFLRPCGAEHGKPCLCDKYFNVARLHCISNQQLQSVPFQSLGKKFPFVFNLIGCAVAEALVQNLS
jgi:hypothetical protein